MGDGPKPHWHPADHVARLEALELELMWLMGLGTVTEGEAIKPVLEGVRGRIDIQKKREAALVSTTEEEVPY